MGRGTTVHGGLDPAELRDYGLRPGEVVDFSANINPLGPSALVRQAAAAADLASYPDRESLALREALGERLGVPVDHLLVGNGSTELIHLLTRSRLRPDDRCVIFAPTFGEYEAAAVATGADVHHCTATEAFGFRLPVEEAVRAIRELRPALVFVCNPNNPTGVYLEREPVERLIEAVGEGGLLLLDDAYASLADSPWDATPLLGCGNVAILRSLTKDHALAGVRLGYLAAQPEVIRGARALQHAWSVNAVAQAAGLAALRDNDHVAAARAVIAEGKAYLCAELAALGLTVSPSATNFLLVKVGDAAGLRRALLRRGLAVRDCASFGLREHIRVAVRGRGDCARLVEALREVLADG